MKEQLEFFLEHLALNENASDHTVRAYQSDLDPIPARSSRSSSTAAAARSCRRTSTEDGFADF